MAGHPRYTAVLDACVLVPAVGMDTLMSLAAAGFFAAKWTTMIEDEWQRAIEGIHPHLEGRLDGRRAAMRDAVLDWEVPASGCLQIIECLSLPDGDDRHVLAAAIVGHADCIVTANRRDFPPESVDPYGIEIIHPDDFIINQWDLSEIEVIKVLKRMRLRKKNPALEVADLAEAFRRASLHKTAERLLTVEDLA